MPWIRDKYRASHVLLHGEHPARDVTEEFEHHIAMRVEENVANGMSPSAARAEALARFGDMDAARTETRRIDEPALHSRRVGERLDTIAHDLRRALRSLARTPVFTLTAFLTLALGLGAMISFFAVLDAVVLHPLAYDHAEELVSIKHPVPGFKANEKWALSSAGYFHFRRESKTLADVGVYERSNVSVSSTGFAERANGAAVTASLLHVLRFRPRIGRLIQESDERASLRGRPAAVVMLGYDFWVGHFGADTNVVDRTLNYEGTPVPIIGVLEKGETLPDQRIDVWVPEQIRPDQRPVNSHHYRAIARLARGASPEAAQAELAGFVAQFTTLYPTAYDPGFMSHFRFGVDVAPLQRETLGGIGRVLWTLFGSVALVLLIACANVANLFLVRADTRQREAAIRIALGAGRGRLAWQYLTESLLLTIAAGVAGLAVAAALTHMVKLRAPSGLPRVGDLAVLPSTYAFALALSAVAGVVFALMQLGRSNAALASLREGGRGLTLSRRQHVVRGALVVAQLAFALVLLAAAGVMVKSFAHLRSVKPGLDPDNVLAFDVVLPQFKYRDWESVEQFHHRLSDRLAALPGVVAVGSGTKIPLDAPGGCSLVFKENWDSAREAAPCEDTPLVAPGYFRALRIPVRGREPGWLDVENRMGGVVVTSAFAARLWPNEDPIGKGIRGNGSGPPFYRVVGVVGDIHDDGLDKLPLRAVFFPILPIRGAELWEPPTAESYLLRTSANDPTLLVGAARRVIAEADPGVALANPRTMNQVVAKSIARVSFTMLLLGAAAFMAVVLSAVGIYGVIAYVVGQRRTEIGIRMALGAGSGEVVTLVAMQSVRLASLGVVIGLAGALLATRALRSLLFEVSPTDPVTLGTVSVALIAVAAIAGWLPARRAARISPLEAIR